MRQFTKDLKEARKADMTPIYTRNNSQWAKDPAAALVSHHDRLMAYRKKWVRFYQEAETQAQIRICLDVLYRIDMMDAEHHNRFAQEVTA